MKTIQMFALAALTVAPALLWIKFAVSQQSAMSANHKFIKRAFFLGIISSISAIIIELSISDLNPHAPNTLHYMVIEQFVCVAMVEELVKLLPVMVIAVNRKAIVNKYDYVVLSIATSMGFALAENILYVIFAKSPFSVAIARMFLSVPSHMCYAVFMGCFCGMCDDSIRNNRICESIFLIVSAVALPTILHGSNNLMLEMNMLFESIIEDGIVLICALYVISFISQRTNGKSAGSYIRFYRDVAIL